MKEPGVFVELMCGKKKLMELRMPEAPRIWDMILINETPWWVKRAHWLIKDREGEKTPAVRFVVGLEQYDGKEIT